jgi:hypothetical protein
MPSFPLKSVLAALPFLALCSGCQSLSNESAFGSVAALYASAGEAGAVALGQFGPMPIALRPAQELQAASGCPGSGPAPQRLPAVCMRSSKTGQLGWLPASDAAAPATPAAQVLHQS